MLHSETALCPSKWCTSWHQRCLKMAPCRFIYGANKGYLCLNVCFTIKTYISDDFVITYFFIVYCRKVPLCCFVFAQLKWLRKWWRSWLFRSLKRKNRKVSIVTKKHKLKASLCFLWNIIIYRFMPEESYAKAVKQKCFNIDTNRSNLLLFVSRFSAFQIFPWIIKIHCFKEF